MRPSISNGRGGNRGSAARKSAWVRFTTCAEEGPWNLSAARWSIVVVAATFVMSHTLVTGEVPVGSSMSSSVTTFAKNPMISAFVVLAHLGLMGYGIYEIQKQYRAHAD